MALATEWYIRETATLLARVSRYKPERDRDYFVDNLGAGFRPSRDLPSVRECFEAFEGLPLDHPLKKRFNPEIVRAGFAILPGLVSPDNYYGDIVFINIRELFGLSPASRLY